MAGGTVHLLVLPNAEEFHTKLRKKIEREEIDPVNVPIDLDDLEWKVFEEKVDAMDGRKVSLFVDVNDNSVDRLLADLEALDGGTITRDLQVNTDEAQSQIDEFSESASEGITRQLDVDFRNADEELRNFTDHWGDMDIRPRVVLDGIGEAKEDAQQVADSWDRMFEKLNKPTGRKVSGVRNLIDVDSDLIDVENFMSRLVRNMDSQFSIGLRQIYDTYFNTLSKMWKAGTKPLLNLREDWNSARSFSDFFSKVGDRADMTKRKIVSFTNDTRNGFKGVVGDIQESGRRIKAVPTEIAASFRELRDTLSKRGGVLGNVKAFLPDFKPLQRHITASAKGIRARMSVDFANIADFTSKHFTSRIKRAFAAVPRAFQAVGRGISSTINKSWDFAKAAGSKVTGLYKVFERMNYGVATAMRTATFVALNQVNFLARDVAKGFDAVAGGVGKGVSKVADRAKGVGRVFKNMADIVGLNMRVVGLNIRDGAARVAKPFKYMADTAGIHMRMMGNSIRNGGRLVGRHAKFAASRMGENMRVMGLFARDGMRTVTGAFSRGFKRVGSHFTYFGRVVSGFGRNFTRAFAKTARAFAPFAAAGIRAFGAVGRAVSGVVRIIGRMGPVFTVFRAIMGRIGRVAMGAARMAMGAFAKLAGMMMKSLMPAIMAVLGGFIAMGGQAVIGAVMALLGALQAVIGGALVMMPALIGAVGVSLAVLKIGAEGLGDSFKAAFSAESVEDFEKAIENLPPAMQAIARSMRQFKPMWDDLVTNVQANMFGGLDDNFASAVGAMLPIFKRGAESMALSWNKSFEGALDALSSPQATAGLEAIMQGAEDMAREMEPVLANLIKAFGSLAEQGAKFLGPVGSWAADKSEDFFNWTEGLKKIDPKTGESFFDGIIASAKKNAALLGDIFGGVFGTLGNVFKAGAEGGGGMLAGMAAGMQELKEYTSEGNEGFEKMVGFMKQATDFASQLGDIVKPLFSGLMSVLTTLSSVGSGAIAGTAELLESISRGLEGFEELGEGFGENIGNIFAALAPIVESLLVTLQPIIAGLGEGLELALVPMLDAAEPFLDTLERMGGPLGELLVTLGGALGKILGPLMSIFLSAFSVLEPVIPILDKVFYYIGEIVGALLVAMEPMFTMRDDAVAGLIDSLGPLVDVLGEGLLGVIEALAPLFPVLGELFLGIVEAVSPLIEPLTKIAMVLFAALIDVIKMVMPVIPPIVSHFNTMAKILSDVLVIALNWLLDTWNTVWPVLASVLKWVVDKVIVPGVKVASAIFQSLAKLIKWAVENVIVPVLNVMRAVFSKVIDVIKWVIERVAKPAIDGLKKAFELAVDGIKAVWNGLKKIFSKPIQFFIDTVVNGAIIPVWNKVMGWIGQDDKQMEKVSKPRDMNFHSGGVLPGYSVGKDNYNFVDTRTGARLGLAGGEGIMRQEFVSAVGGEKGISRLNEDARHGRLKASPGYHDRSSAAHNQGGVIYLGNFAQGGVVEAMTRIVQQKYPMLQMTSGYDNRPGNHGRGLAADFSNGHGNTPEQLALAHDIAKTYPNSMELIYDAPGWSGNIKDGANVGAFGGFYNMAQAGPHHHHVHWAMNTPPTMPFGGGVFEGGSGGGGVGGFIDQAANWFKEKFAFVTDAFSGITDKLKKQIGNAGVYGGMAIDMAKSTVDGVKDWAKSKLQEMNPLKGLFGGGDVDLSGISGDLVKSVEEVFARHGFTGQQWEDAKWIINNESSWNPNAQNPTSTAYGLFQFLDTTWAEVGATKTSDPVAQADAGAKYMKKRYGNPTEARRFWEANNWYDAGGEAVGTGLMAKNVITPERVLSPMQTKAFNAFVYQFMPEMIEQFKRNPQNFAKIGNQVTRELKRINHELREGRIKAIQHNVADTYRRRLSGENLQTSPVDLNFDMDWLKRNEDNLQRSYHRASKQIGMVYSDPEAYVEAEKRAREQIDKEREAAREAEKKAEEESAEVRKEEAEAKKATLEERRKEAEEAGDDARVKQIDSEIDALSNDLGDRFEVEGQRIEDERSKAKEEAKKELEEEKTKLQEERDKAEGAEREAIDSKIESVDERIRSVERTVDKKFDEQKAANDAAQQAEQDRLQRIEDRENERIERAKADGSYYYGYKVFNDEGADPREIERSKEETAFREFMGNAADRVGLGEAFEGLSKTFDDVRSINEASQIAMPAWIAALNGDPSGLAHNIAVGQAATISQARTEATDLGPEALAGILEMAISGGSVSRGNNAPFIGEVNSGMTQAELMQTLEYYEMKRARRGTGTTRVR